MTRDQRRAALNRKSKRELASMCRIAITTPDSRKRVIEGTYPLEQWNEEELVGAILNVEYGPGRKG